jgi:hypothetical protein
MVMNIRMKWGPVGFGFWAGTGTLSLVELAVIMLNHNVLAYNEYMLAISIIVLIIGLSFRIWFPKESQ